MCVPCTKQPYQYQTYTNILIFSSVLQCVYKIDFNFIFYIKLFVPNETIEICDWESMSGLIIMYCQYLDIKRILIVLRLVYT
jgi:hypothetical protein